MGSGGGGGGGTAGYRAGAAIRRHVGGIGVGTGEIAIVAGCRAGIVAARKECRAIDGR